MDHRAGSSGGDGLSWSTSIVAAGYLPVPHDLPPGDASLMSCKGQDGVRQVRCSAGMPSIAAATLRRSGPDFHSDHR